MNARFPIPDPMRLQAFDYYARHESITVEAIATFLGVTPHRFWRLRRTWGWPPRADAMVNARSREPSTLLPEPGADAPKATRSLRDAAASLAHVTHLRLDALVTDQAAQVEIDHDRTARVLSAYAKTLTIAQSLLDQEQRDFHEPEPHRDAPRDLGALRDELAAHLERVVAEEEARGSDGLLV